MTHNDDLRLHVHRSEYNVLMLIKVAGEVCVYVYVWGRCKKCDE